ncbi:coiled-coil domain-containing protein 87 isoform X2 [Denticeps clupeoides]|uniref:coiled-coil domain-containing protein 87 isoform X2 n=1 Tax=Denticeps clupeoides TaxID=299321 RepID=UPI0010A3B579|nr:coiled-coil domain-containing protein 87 isoform X2 [Denticeps clupeoides]
MGTLPKSQSELWQRLQEQIRRHAGLPPALLEDQSPITSVMTSELGLIWEELKSLRHDPSLTLGENEQLRIDVCSEVLRLSEQLYLSNLYLLDFHRRHGVTDQKSQSQVIAQMTGDCRTFLNVHNICWKVTMGIRAARKSGMEWKDGGEMHGPTETHSALARLHMSQTCRKEQVATEVPDSQEGASDFVPYLQDITREGELQSILGASSSHPKASIIGKEVTDHLCCTRRKGCNSVPDLQRSSTPPQPLLLLNSGCFTKEHTLDSEKDLKRLLQGWDVLKSSEVAVSDLDLPPLIMASSYMNYKKQEVERHAEEKRCQTKSRVVQQSRPFQADTVTIRSHQVIIHMSPSRVSDRVLKDSINVQVQSPVYNHLTGELDLSSVELLDHSLCAATDMTQVKEELSKSVSTEYFTFERDPMIEPAITDENYCMKRRNYEKTLINTMLKCQTTSNMSYRKRTESNRKGVDVTPLTYTESNHKSDFSVDDFLGKINNQHSDFLPVIFHLYNECGDDKERAKNLQTEEKKQRRMKMLEALKEMKHEYVKGEWNMNSVLFGGLWKEPVLEEEDSEERPSSFNQMDGSLVTEPSTLVEEQVDGKHQQNHLEKIWRVLCLPEAQRMDMAIKYSSTKYKSRLEQVIAAWEEAARLIQQREAVLCKLECFERHASDPRRFFLHGSHGSSIIRMEESKQREKLNGQIATLDKVLSKTISQITKRFGDTVTYNGRPYKEKMRWDRTEMLYWLQEERRVQALRTIVLPDRLSLLNSSQSRDVQICLPQSDFISQEQSIPYRVCP